MANYKSAKGKQHDTRAASFIRIAKAIRKLGDPGPPILRKIARIFDDEAKMLRSMR